MESQKLAPWAAVAALAIGFSFGKWDGEKTKPAASHDELGNYFATTVTPTGIVVTNTRTGDVFLCGTDLKWVALPPVPVIAPTISGATKFDPDAYLRGKPTPSQGGGAGLR